MKDRSNKLILLLGSLACLALPSIVNADGRLFVWNLENSTGLMGFREAEQACASLHARLASSAELRHAVVQCFFSTCTRGWLHGGTVGTTVCNVVAGAPKAVDVKTENVTEDVAPLNAFCIKDRGVPCGDPPSFPNVRLQGHSGYELGDELLYTCVPGFVMPNGHKAFSLLCDSCGEWYGMVEICLKDETEGLVDYEDKHPDIYGGLEDREQRAEEANGEVREEVPGPAHTGWKPSQQHQETTFSLEQEKRDATVEGDMAANGEKEEEEKAVGDFVGHPLSEQEPEVTADAATEANVSVLSQKQMFWFPSEAFQDEVTQRDSTIQSEESKENESQEMNRYQNPAHPDDSHQESDHYAHRDPDDNDSQPDAHHRHYTPQDYDGQPKPYAPAQHHVQDRLDHPRKQDNRGGHYDMGEHDEDHSRARDEGQEKDERDDIYHEHESYEDHEDVTEDRGGDDQEHLDDSQEHPDHDDNEGDEDHYDHQEDHRDHYTNTDDDDDDDRNDDDHDNLSDDHDDHNNHDDLSDAHDDHNDHHDLSDDQDDHNDHNDLSDDHDDHNDLSDDHRDHDDHDDHDERHHRNDHNERHHRDDHDDLSDDDDNHDDHDTHRDHHDDRDDYDDQHHHDNNHDDLIERTDENNSKDSNERRDRNDDDHNSYEDQDSHEDDKDSDYHVNFSITRDHRQNITEVGDGGKTTTDETWLDGHPAVATEGQNENSMVQRSKDEDKDTGAFNEVESHKPLSHTSLPEESKSSSKEPPLQQEAGQETWPGFIPTATPTSTSEREHAAPTYSWSDDLTRQSFISRDPAPPVRDNDAIMEEHTMHNLPGETGERGEMEGELGETVCTGENCPPPASAGQSSKVASIIVVVCLVAIAVMVTVWCYRRQQQKSSVYEMNVKGQSQGQCQGQGQGQGQSRPAQQMEMQQKV